MHSENEEPHSHSPERYISVLGRRGFVLNKDSKILDFCCGSGQRVRDFRRLGLQAYGFDIYDSLKLSVETERRYFEVHTNVDDLNLGRDVDWGSFRLPYEDNTFDFVFSVKVMEHLQNHDAALKELARVMKRKSIAIHTFPAMFRFIEPHIRVPFGGIIKSQWYYALWARLGLRHEYQKGAPAKQAAQTNYVYARQSLNYQTPAVLRRKGLQYFQSSEFIPHLWDTDRIRLNAVHYLRRFRTIYTYARHVFWCLEDKR
jgi:SAM-dependent methyltransferase